MDDAELVGRARGGDADAKRAVVERATLRGARAILGSSAAERADLLRELARGDGAAPQLGVLLAAIALDGDGEVRRASECVRRTATDRWGPPERAAIGRFAAAHGARLGAEEALELVEWAARFPGDLADVLAGARAALEDVGPDAERLQRIAWSTGFEAVVRAGGPLVERWAAQPAMARAVASALLSAHARERGSAVPALAQIWERTAARDVWAAALGHAVAQSSGMSGRDAIVAWSWERFCAEADERALLYAAFAPWRELWVERRNQQPRHARPGGESAVAHLALWGGLDVEQLSRAVGEAARLAEDREWAALVDVAFDLAERARGEHARHAFAGACAMAHEVTNRARDAEISEGVASGAARLEVRALACAAQLRASGAVLDEILANRAEDLETSVRLIREARERREAHARAAVERAEREAAREHALTAAEEARRAADEAQRRAQAELSARLAAPVHVVEPPRTDQPPDAQPLDLEIFFASLPAPTLLAYARMFKRLSQADGVQSVLADGVTMEMLAVINQTWAALFQRRPELALRFSQLVSAPWV